MLNHCNIDGDHPMLREWGIFAVRNLCGGNLENQAAIEDLELQGVAPSPMLPDGADAKVTVDPKTGKPSVRVVNGSRATSNVSMNRLSKELHGVDLNEPLGE